MKYRLLALLFVFALPACCMRDGKKGMKKMPKKEHKMPAKKKMMMKKNKMMGKDKMMMTKKKMMPKKMPMKYGMKEDMMPMKPMMPMESQQPMMEMEEMEVGEMTMPESDGMGDLNALIQEMEMQEGMMEQ